MMIDANRVKEIFLEAAERPEEAAPGRVPGPCLRGRWRGSGPGRGAAPFP